MNWGYELWIARGDGLLVPLLSERDMLPVRYVGLEDAVSRARLLSQSGDIEVKAVSVYKRLGVEKADLVWSSDKAVAQ